MFSPDYFSEDFYAADYFPPAALDSIEITVPGPGGGDSRKGGLSYKPYYEPIDLPAEDLEDIALREQILREDEEMLELIQVIMAIGIIK